MCGACGGLDGGIPPQQELCLSEPLSVTLLCQIMLPLVRYKGFIYSAMGRSRISFKAKISFHPRVSGLCQDKFIECKHYYFRDYNALRGLILGKKAPIGTGDPLHPYDVSSCD